MKIYIKPDKNFYRPILYTLLLIENNQHLQIQWVAQVKDADIIFDDSHKDSQVIATSFYENLISEKPNLIHRDIFNKSQVICDDQGTEDMIASIFYMVNCLQEYQIEKDDLDQYGRFKFQSTYQHKYCSIERNLVQDYIEKWLSTNKIESKSHESEIFISHDIDYLHTAIIPFSSKVIRSSSPSALLNTLIYKILRKPNLESLDQILKINNLYDLQSSFFWLVENEKGNHDIPNADYAYQQDYSIRTRSHGGINALHKSSRTISMDEEFEKGGFDAKANRYHYLAHLPHRSWPEISASQIELDASLGFAEVMGFRNSYGQAFQPFDIKTLRPYDFVEAPLHIMDTTFERYLEIDQTQIAPLVIDFIEKNKLNCTISLLWHNQHFNKYDIGTFLNAYKQIVTYVYENKLKCITPTEIIGKRKLRWPLA